MELLPQLHSQWTDVSVDFIVDLPASRGKCHTRHYTTIIVIINWYTKQLCYFPGQHMLVAAGLAEILIKTLVLRGAGVPQCVVSNRGP
jgi:hypothetical protein